MVMATKQKQKKSKNQLRRERLKQKKLEGNNADEDRESKESVVEIKTLETVILDNNSDTSKKDDTRDVDQREVSSNSTRLFESDIDKYLDDPQFQDFKRVINRFYMPEEHSKDSANGDTDAQGNVIYSDDEKADGDDDDDDDDGKDDDQDKKPLSRRQLRKKNKIPLAVLKAEAKRPNVVEWYDVDANDPKLLVYIKCLKNVIPVPPHWQFKREYLSSKRGVEKPPFQLPKFIEDTGIVNMRDTTQLDDQTLKQKAREKVQPKMGKLDLDYEKLHDAFFKHQEKPRLYGYGDIYYEGKEQDEIDLKGIRPGKVSDKLRKALGIQNFEELPWINNMRRFGPPPSYPGLRVAGLELQFYPESFQNMENKDPADELKEFLVPTENEHWGELKSVDEEQEEEEEEEGDEDSQEGEDVEYEDSEDEAEVVDESDMVPISSVEVRSGVSLSTNGMKAVDDDGKPKKLYEVLEEKQGENSRKEPLSYKIRGRDEYEKDDNVDNEEDVDEMAIKRAKYESEKQKDTFKF
ncbi:U2 snRNP complex subunit [Saccharomycopsis crataegensis]|uniref:U2 snRNP complex subunit n=1 Tax=Saccharomycopsis crataegensis TaxID=43959 RepID=A0AAV5QL01_9ASCO|nr:U2 snRNP complex subunit [Saccharomycopsis crataegensis]